MAPELVANFLAPYLVYQALSGRFGDVTALIASAMPPLLWSGYELIKTRRPGCDFDSGGRRHFVHGGGDGDGRFGPADPDP